MDTGACDFRGRNDEDAYDPQVFTALSAIAVLAMRRGARSGAADQAAIRQGRPRVLTGRAVRTGSYQQGRTRVYVTKRSWPMPAPKCCLAIANSRTTPSRRKSATHFRAREQEPPDRSPAAQSAVGPRRLSDALPAVLIRRDSDLSRDGRARHGHWRRCCSTKERSPAHAGLSISRALRVQLLQLLQDRLAHLRGLAAVVPSDLMSAVRRPLASTAAIAASILSASAPMSKE